MNAMECMCVIAFERKQNAYTLDTMFALSLPFSILVFLGRLTRLHSMYPRLIVIFVKPCGGRNPRQYVGRPNAQPARHAHAEKTGASSQRQCCPWSPGSSQDQPRYCISLIVFHLSFLSIKQN